MKQILILLMFFSNTIALAQLNEEFSDGDFTNNPIWAGNGGDFLIIDGKLRSNSNNPNTSSFLSTGNTLVNNVKWELWVNLQFSTSGSNYVDIYIISDKADLKATSIHGYFVRIGNTDDEISLYKRSGTAASSVKIIDGANGSVGSSNNTVKIKLTRDNIGKFTLEREVISANSSYITEGSFTDATHTASSHFGILIQQSTASFFLKHFFDNFKIQAIVNDVTSPSLITVVGLDTNTVEITFDEPMDSVSIKAAANYQINNKAGLVSNVKTTSDPAKFHLKMVNALQRGLYIIAATNVKDKNGNLIGLNNSASFTYINPYIPKFGDLVINEIFPDPTPQIDLPSVEFVELRNNTDRTISLKNWKLNDSGSEATFGEIKLDPKSFLILCAKADTAEYKEFGKVLGLSPWPSLNNSGEILNLISPENLPVDSVRYTDAWYRNSTKKQGGWTLERRDPQTKCVGLFNWFASADSSGGTPGRENSMYFPGYDLLPLSADSLKQVSDTSVIVYFNKHLNSSTLLLQNFELAPNKPILKKIITDSDSKTATLTYDQKFQSGIEYQIKLHNVQDCSGTYITNDLQGLKFKISKPSPPSTGNDTARITITEIFVDPSPEVNLPLAEFIEIYNPLKDPVDLDKWTINDPTTKAIIRGQKILPGEYIILCPVADTIYYRFFGKSIGLSPWPSLNNGSDQITLKSLTGRIVDSLAYSDSWYRSNIKKSGGWSLEKIDLQSICEGLFNWTASLDTIGGTPGRRNSVNISGYDRSALTADSLTLLSDTTIKIYFNKHLDNSTLTAANFNLSPDNVIKKITANTESQEAVLTYSKKFQPTIHYTLTVLKLKDCGGNFITGKSSFRFKLNPLPPLAPEQPDTARILITEIFADPSPEIGLPLAEYIEIHNPGRETIDLNKWILSDSATKGLITNTTIAPGGYLILCPVADTVSFKQFGQTKGISPWPSLGNTSDQLTLKSFRQRLVDSVAYSDGWYKNKTKKSGGWSLEKIDIQNNVCNGFYNWDSSIHPSGGTPGRANSISIPKGTSRDLKIDSVKNTSDSTVIVFLNRVADTAVLKPSNFFINNTIGKATWIAKEDDYKKINLRFRSKFLEGIQYILTADSLFNCAGEKIISPNNYASFTIPVVPEIIYPVIINEIFADPSPQIGLPEIEFVELYNPTERIVNLKGMSYGDQSVQHKFTRGELAPKSYLILCPERDTLNFSDFGNVMGLPTWPSLGNDKDILTLKNNKGREFHKVAYNSSWYKDSKKKAGGFSLEMINPASICKDSQNWEASQDSTGGTPGRQNSVYDSSISEGLKLLTAVLTDSTTLLLTFNKSVDSLSASITKNYQLNNGVGKPDSVMPVAPAFKQVMLKFREQLARGHSYRVDVTHVRDCAGSDILTNFDFQEFILTQKIVKNSILISEILFNPKPGGIDFVELYNNTQHTLDLRDLSIGTIAKDTLSGIKQISPQQLLFEPGNYLAITSDPHIILKDYVVENPGKLFKAMLPQFNDDKGTVLLLSNGIRVDQLDYTEKMHFQLLKNLEGVSLERSSFITRTNENGNFRSATASAGFATPGYKNSQFSQEPGGDAEFALTTRTFSPDNDGFDDVIQISYHLPSPGMVANVKIFNDKGVLIKNLLKNSTLNSNGIIAWDGLNEFNTLAVTGIYFLYAEIFDTNGNLKRFRKSFALAAKL